MRAKRPTKIPTTRGLVDGLLGNARYLRLVAVSQMSRTSCRVLKAAYRASKSVKI